REVTTRGLGFLDGPVSGTSAMVARGDGLIIAGGDASVFERCRPALAAMLPRGVHIGPAGHATLLNMRGNLLGALPIGRAAWPARRRGRWRARRAWISRADSRSWRRALTARACSTCAAR